MKEIFTYHFCLFLRIFSHYILQYAVNEVLWWLNWMNSHVQKEKHHKQNHNTIYNISIINRAILKWYLYFTGLPIDLNGSQFLSTSSFGDTRVLKITYCVPARIITLAECTAMGTLNQSGKSISVPSDKCFRLQYRITTKYEGFYKSTPSL